jgi:hypothetical protein
MKKRGRALRRRYGRAMAPHLAEMIKDAVKGMSPDEKKDFKAAVRRNMEMGEGADMAVHLAIAEVGAGPWRHVQHGQARSRLDMILDSVRPREHEVTIDTEDLTNAQVQQVIGAAKARGLHTAFDGRFVLVRDMR